MGMQIVSCGALIPVIRPQHPNPDRNWLDRDNAESFKRRLLPKRKRLRPFEASQRPSKKLKLSVAPFLDLVGQPPRLSRIDVLSASFSPSPSLILCLFAQSPTYHQDLIRKSPRFTKPEKEPNYVVPLPVPSNDVPTPPTHATMLTKRVVRFRVNKGQDFVYFEVLPKANGCYDGRVRVGSFPDNGTNGEYSERFSLGTAHAAINFVSNLRKLELDEQHQAKARLEAAEAQANAQRAHMPPPTSSSAPMSSQPVSRGPPASMSRGPPRSLAQVLTATDDRLPHSRASLNVLPAPLPRYTLPI